MPPPPRTPAANYYIVYTNPGGSVTSSVASVTVIVPPAHTQVSYSNQVYHQTFDSLPDPGYAGVAANGTASGNGVSVNSINNPLDPGFINGLAYSLANPFDFAYPVIASSYLGGPGPHQSERLVWRGGHEHLGGRCGWRFALRRPRRATNRPRRD